MTELEQIRQNLGDSYVYAEDKQTGDGESKIYELNHKHVKDGSQTVYKDNTEIDEGTDYTIDNDAGVISLSEVLETTEELRVVYQFSAFTDTELSFFLESAGTVDGATMKAIRVLMVDAARRFDYTTGKTEMKASQVFEHLKDLLKIYQDAVNRQSGGVKKVRRTSDYYDATPVKNYDLSRLVGADKGADFNE